MKRAVFALAATLAASPVFAEQFTGDRIDNINNLSGEVISSLTTVTKEKDKSAAMIARTNFDNLGYGALKNCVRDAYAAAAAGGISGGTVASVVCRTVNGYYDSVVRCEFENKFDKEPTCRWVHKP